MATRLNSTARNAAAAAAANSVDDGPAAGKLRIYTGSQPASADSAATGTLLAELTLSDPAFGAPSNGVATANAITPANAGATGTAGWFRLTTSDGTARLDGSVTATGGGGDLTLDNTSIASGQQVQVNSLTYTQPAG